jgi:hypothetical protein
MSQRVLTQNKNTKQQFASPLLKWLTKLKRDAKCNGCCQCQVVNVNQVRDSQVL